MLRSNLQWVLLLCICSASAVDAQQAASLPDPLSLQQALQMIDEEHPVLLQSRMAGFYAKTDLQRAEAANSVRVDIDGRLRWTDSSVDHPVTRDAKDHKLRLIVSKPIYDGGDASASRRAAYQSGLSADIDYAYSRELYSITVMQQFFGIMLADLKAARELEAMSTAFVRMDRGQDNHELGKISDVDLTELQSLYQEARLKSYSSDGEARSSRQLLALTLNRPGQQPSQITPPELNVNSRKLLPYDVLLGKVLAGNQELVAMNHAIQAARSRVTAAESGFKPRVEAVLERAEQSRETSSADKWRVGVELSVPLYDGGRNEVIVRRAHLDVNKLIYQRQQFEFELRSQVRELAERFRVLTAEYDASQAFADYRELYLDRSRALYDLEVKTDLGDAMVQISDSHLRSARQLFDMSLLLAQLNLLAGEMVMNWDALTSSKTKSKGGGS